MVRLLPVALVLIALAAAAQGAAAGGEGAVYVPSASEHSAHDVLGKSISLSAASGANAVGVAVNGARIDFGAGASDYASSNGTNVTFQAPAVTMAGDVSVNGASTFGGGPQVLISSAGQISGSSSNPAFINDADGAKIGDGAGTEADGTLLLGRYRFTEQASVIADNANGSTAATSTQTPTASYLSLTCNDANGCTITMSEAGAANGDVVQIVNLSANACNFADTSGVTELAGVFAMGRWDTLTLLYATDRWVELDRSNN